MFVIRMYCPPELCHFTIKLTLLHVGQTKTQTRAFDVSMKREMLLLTQKIPIKRTAKTDQNN